MPSLTVQQALETGTQLQRAGRLAEAERVYRQLLAQQPDCADALHLLGIIHAQRGQVQDGVDLIRRAIDLYPAGARYYANLAHILAGAKRLEEAAQAYRQTAELQPGNPEAYNDLGTALFAVNRLDESIAAYRQAVAMKDGFPSAWSNLANALHQQHHLSEALDCCKKALAIQPNFAEAMGVLANVLGELGRLDESIAQYEKAIAVRPEMAELHQNLATALFQRGRTAEALAASDKAVALRPNDARAWANRAKMLRESGRLGEAMVAVHRALAISHDLAEAHQNLATIYLDSDKVAEAVESSRRALELSPGMAEAHNVLGNALKEDGLVADAIDCFDRALAHKPSSAAIHSNKIYAMEFNPECDAPTLLREQRRWNQVHAAPLKRLAAWGDVDRSPDRKLRIGYISPYFFHHSESFFVVPLLESHDHGQFEIHCYSDAALPDAVTDRLRRCADAWHDCRGRSDAEVAEQIHGDRIDILIDLTMHMGHNRALALVRKPAPVQVAWLAYPGGTGMDAMDYRITDPWIDPPGADESGYIERSIRLPNCWCCYDPLSDAPPSLVRAGGPIRFGSLNNPCKLNEPLLRLWTRVMQGAPDSRLLLQILGTNHRKRILDLFQSLNIPPDRLEFVARCGRPEYLRLYDRIDICLDPLPYNGITTTCDALWMGVPVTTLAGKTAAGRAGTSILANVGLSDLAARDSEQFVQIATSLAADLPRLAELRASLRQRITRSPVMDKRKFADDMEAAYRKMWREAEIRNPKSE